MEIQFELLSIFLAMWYMYMSYDKIHEPKKTKQNKTKQKIKKINSWLEYFVLI